MRIKASGINTVHARLASGDVKTYYYHRATGKRLVGEPGSVEFLTSFAAAEQSLRQRHVGTLSGVMRDFEQTRQWRRLAESTRKEYKRVLIFWDAHYGTCPYGALEDKAFRAEIIKCHDKFSEAKPREADNRVAILARVLSWAAKDGPLKANVLDGFERAYASDRSDIIWLPEQIEAFMAVASPEMQFAMVLALHTGQRQADILRLTWSQYDGASITLRQGKARRLGRAAPAHSRPLHKGVKSNARFCSAPRGCDAYDKDRFAVQEAIFCRTMGRNMQGRRHRGSSLPRYPRHHRHDAGRSGLHSSRNRFHHRPHLEAGTRYPREIFGTDEQSGGERHREV